MPRFNENDRVRLNDTRLTGVVTDVFDQSPEFGTWVRVRHEGLTVYARWYHENDLTSEA